MPNYSGLWTSRQQMQATAASLWPATPGAPTIGTATKASSTSVSVTFTAPSNLGVPAIITGYTVTSSPGGLTGTGSSSPIVVSGLTTGTAYTFTVTATNATGTGAASAASNSVTPTLAIGDAYGGGFFAGQINQSGTVYNLVVAPKSGGETVAKWKTGNTGDSGCDSFIDGPANTNAVDDAAHPAAQFCNGLTIGGYTDWYWPARNELEVCYYYLKPNATANSTSSGSNANAVSPEPISTNYSSGSPAQTSVAAFQTGGAQVFIAAGYFSSTQYDIDTSRGWSQDFNAGGQGTNPDKNTGSNVRAVRRVAA